jgi:hypothetical protein
MMLQMSAHFLGEQKEDVHHSTTSDLQNNSASPPGCVLLKGRAVCRLQVTHFLGELVKDVLRLGLYGIVLNP